MLQIRNLPDDVYEALSFRARREKRSLAQQAVVELSRVPTSERSGKRRAALQAIREEISREGFRRVESLPEDLIREDRER